MGKRLPHEWEWQYAAQCGDCTKMLPWGSTWDTEAVPQPQFGGRMQGPADIGIHPKGTSR